MDSQPNILQLVAQYAQLEEQLQPLLPSIGQKLVSDLLSTGASSKRLGKVLGRSPSWVQAVAGGNKSLSAKQIVSILRHVAAKQKDETDAA